MTKNPRTIKAQKDAVISSLLDVQLKTPQNIDAKAELDIEPSNFTYGTDFVADEIVMQGRNPTKKGVQLQ